MFVVIFEVRPKRERRDEYLDLAKYLKPKLEAIDGFIGNDRYRSKLAERRLLSLSTWRDEKSVIRWRTHGEHHAVQQKGRFEIFEDYHLRVGEVSDDSDPPPGLGIAQQRFDETATASAKAVSITEITVPETRHVDFETGPLSALGLDRHADGLVGQEVFESIYNPGNVLLLATWRDAAAAEAWTPAPSPVFDGAKLRHRRVRVIRDYGMYDRREAPQYYPDVLGTRAAWRRNDYYTREPSS